MDGDGHAGGHSCGRSRVHKGTGARGAFPAGGGGDRKGRDTMKNGERAE
ncbi:hypothetical protein [Actinomadura litoris]|nr:hypothetical protein [Actinomadura litoris]